MATAARRTRPRSSPISLIADDIAALIAALGLQRPVVGGWSDGGQVTLELQPVTRSRGASIVGAAYPDFDRSGLREAHRALLGADDAGAPDPDHLDAELGEFAEEIKALHPGGAEQWRRLVRQTAPMWLDYEGLGPDELEAIRTPVLVLAGDRDELIPLDLSLSLYRALPDAELAVCPSAEPRRPDARARCGPRQRDPRLRPAARPCLSSRNDRKELVMFADTKAYSGLAVDDMQKAREFYGETLGLRTSEEYGRCGCTSPAAGTHWSMSSRTRLPRATRS